MKNKVTVSYTKLVFVVMVGLFLYAGYKLTVVAFCNEVDGTNLRTYASNRNTVTKTLFARRGNIYDVENNVLATTVNSYTIVAYLSEKRSSDGVIRHVVDKEDVANKLSSILNIDKDKLLKILSKDKYQVELKRDVTELTKSKIDELNLVGIGYEESVDRYYQSGSFASYLIGYAKKNDEGKIVGELGIEGYYNTLLTGKDGKNIYQKDAYGYKMPNTYEYIENSTSGANVHLTIDSNIQLILENATSKISKKEGFDWGVMAVMDAKTGAIVASSTLPSFNPNDLNTIGDNYLNPLVSYQYEPGSTMKTFSFASSIEEGLYDGNATFESGSIVVGDATIRDVNRVGWGTISYDTGFAYSSNVATTHIALKLGKDKLKYYYDKLGFGNKTGVELSNEFYGSVKFKYDVEVANAAFGQGMSVTPIQMLQAYTTITNDGEMLKPYIVDKIVGDNGKILYQGGKEVIGKVYSKATVDYMKKLMHNAIYENTNDLYEPDNVNIIGKTGTAQIYGKGGYLTGENDYIRSFAGIFPSENPEYIMYVAVSKYQDKISTFADIITTAIEEISSYAKISSNQNNVYNEKIVVDNYLSKEVNVIKSDLEKKGVHVTVVGNKEYVIDQYPYKGNVLYSGDRLFLVSNDDEIVMPDVTGFSLNEIKTLCDMIGIDVKINGRGYVTSQSIAVGSILDVSGLLEVILSNG